MLVQLNSVVMKVLLDIKDEKAKFVMGLLRKLPYVKVKQLEAIHFQTFREVVDAKLLAQKRRALQHGLELPRGPE